MATTTQMTWRTRMALSPSVVHSPAFKEIEARADKVHEKLDLARSRLPSCISKEYSQAYAEVRQLRKELSALDVESRRQFHLDNPAWVAHWGVDKVH